MNPYSYDDDDDDDTWDRGDRGPRRGVLLIVLFLLAFWGAVAWAGCAWWGA